MMTYTGEQAKGFLFGLLIGVLCGVAGEYWRKPVYSPTVSEEGKLKVTCVGGGCVDLTTLPGGFICPTQDSDHLAQIVIDQEGEIIRLRQILAKKGWVEGE